MNGASLVSVARECAQEDSQRCLQCEAVSMQGRMRARDVRGAPRGTGPALLQSFWSLSFEHARLLEKAAWRSTQATQRVIKAVGRKDNHYMTLHSVILLSMKLTQKTGSPVFSVLICALTY